MFGEVVRCWVIGAAVFGWCPDMVFLDADVIFRVVV